VEGQGAEVGLRGQGVWSGSLVGGSEFWRVALAGRGLYEFWSGTLGGGRVF
jgi:hypothetical protein